jgi:hypothetical protein
MAPGSLVDSGILVLFESLGRLVGMGNMPIPYINHHDDIGKAQFSVDRNLLAYYHQVSSQLVDR